MISANLRNRLKTAIGDDGSTNELIRFIDKDFSTPLIAEFTEETLLLNDGGDTATLGNAGIDLEGGGSIVGYMKIDPADITKMILKAPTGSVLTLDTTSNATLAISNGLTVSGAAPIEINQTLTTTATPTFTALKVGTGLAGLSPASNGAIFEGYVGIGATIVSRPLTIEGTENEMARIINTVNGGDCVINLRTSFGVDKNWAAGIKGSDGGYYISNSANVGTNDRFVIDTSGNVGIGTTTPTALLHTVDGAVKFEHSSSNLLVDFESSDSAILKFVNNGVSESTSFRTNRHFKFDTGDTVNNALVINASGSVSMGTTLTVGGEKVTGKGSFVIALGDETTAITTGTAKVTFRMPYAFKLTGVRASLSTAGTGANLVTIDINEGGSTILSTKLTIDATEKTSTTAATAAVISDTALADDAEITIDIDQIDSGAVAAGPKITFFGFQS